MVTDGPSKGARITRDLRRTYRLKSFNAVIGMLAVSVILSACGARESGAMRAYLLQDGDWGWDNGAGCEGDIDIWRFDREQIEMYRDGVLVDRGIRLTRTVRHDEGETLGSGPPSGLVLTYVGAAPDNRE